MKRSKVEVYLHFVWTTERRENWIPAEKEKDIHAVIAAEAIAQKALVLALNGMSDHIHLVVKMPPSVSISRFMQQVKGVSSTAIREAILPEATDFGWQDNYGVFSFHQRHLETVCNYVKNQKVHHANQTTRQEWEEADEEGGVAAINSGNVVAPK
jgi:putative transposase